MDDEDDLLDAQPSRVRLRVLVGALVVAVVASGVGLWWMYRPHPPTPDAPVPAVEPDPINLRREELEAKKLPEYTEVGPIITRPSTDAEIARVIELSRHPNAWIRLLARGRLAKVIDGPRRPDAVNAIAAGLREPSLVLRADAMYHLGSMNARECEAELRAFLTSPVEDDRTLARRALRRMGLPVD